MNAAVALFDRQFEALSGHPPFRWQRRLFERFATGEVPAALDLPTGLGKTSVMAIWLIARAQGAALPRRLVYVVDRRAVVDQATDEAETLRKALAGDVAHRKASDADTLARAQRTVAELRELLGFDGKSKLPISTLRGAHADNREWLDDPAAPAIIVGTVDMIGSRLLFAGYGVSSKMRPYQAGLLGVDALVVLDEAHLVPPFAHLLRSIEQDVALRPSGAADRELLPPFVLLPLSATQREAGGNVGDRTPFGLKEEDWDADLIARKRLKAVKRLSLEPLTHRDQDMQLAEAAFALATKDGRRSRVVIFCDRREQKDEGGGPSAQGVKQAIENMAKADRKVGRERTDIHEPELLVGARRVHEREGVAKRLRDLRFIGEKTLLDKPAFLVATSAGEVGVDIDADHMVCDLVAWERMVQRLGRVNRRGEAEADIRVFWSESSVKDTRAPSEPERRALTAFASKEVIARLPQADGVFDASPGAFWALTEAAQGDAALKASIEAATTREPLRPALNRALVEAWSMTSLETHTGRPEVAPWLRGWAEEERPQTTIVWRTHLPIREGIASWLRTEVEKKEIGDFFEAAAPHESEKLETETYRVVEWLEARSRSLKSEKPTATDVDAETKEEVAPPEDAPSTEDLDPARAASPRRDVGANDVVVVVLSRVNEFEATYTRDELAKKRDSNSRKALETALGGKTLVVDARLGGLSGGMLVKTCDEAATTADSAPDWSEEAGFRVRRDTSHYARDEVWRFEDAFVLRDDEEGEPAEWLIVEHFRDAAQTEDARSIAKPQELASHQDRARSEMSRIATALRLPEAAVAALAVGAGLHDEGKRAARWQRAFQAPRDIAKFRLTGPLAKTLGPIKQAILDGYRHEFGSLPHVEENAEFKALADDWQELVLHLIAAHHGGARPVIGMRGCEDAPPSVLEARARDVALRFARLQKRWGPWGLAWWEALLRAADRRASRDNDAGGTSRSKEKAHERGVDPCRPRSIRARSSPASVS